MNGEHRLTEILDRLDEVEAGLDPVPRQRGQLYADLATLAILVPMGIVIDWDFNRPFLLLGLLLGAVGLNRFLWYALRLPLRRERDMLLQQIREESLTTLPSEEAGR